MLTFWGLERMMFYFKAIDKNTLMLLNRLQYPLQTGSMANPASCTMGTGGYFPERKTAVT
jgi:hypothetical protein